MSHAHAVAAAPRIDVLTTRCGTFEITAVHTDATHATVQIRGEVDLSTAPLVAAVLDDHLSLGQRFVRLDLSLVSFLDCAGLRVIIEAHNAYLAARGTLILTGLGARTIRLLTITHLDEALLVADGPGEPKRARRCSHLSSVPDR